MATILVIDDEPPIRELLRLLLEQRGHHPICAEGGLVGVQAARMIHFDLVFCDLFMPGQDGIETIRILRQEHPNLAIVAMSGGGYNGTLDVMSLALSLGACCPLDKPFSSSQVDAALTAALS